MPYIRLCTLFYLAKMDNGCFFCRHHLRGSYSHISLLIFWLLFQLCIFLASWHSFFCSLNAAASIHPSSPRSLLLAKARLFDKKKLSQKMRYGFLNHVSHTRMYTCTLGFLISFLLNHWFKPNFFA